MKNIFCTTIWFVLLCETAFSQSGTLDKSFGIDGKVINETFTGNCKTVAVQDDGKILTGGFHDSFNHDEKGIIIARFNMDGSLDEGFGESGKTIITKGEGFDLEALITLTIQEDGKIIAGGMVTGNTSNHYSDICIIRLNTNGTLDSSFGDDGIFIENIGKDDVTEDLVIQNDGKIIVTGAKGLSADNDSQPFVMRISSTGKLDESFGEKGIILISENLDVYNVKAISIQTDNKILIAGQYFGNSFYVMRFLPDGSFDKTFDEEKDGITGIEFEAVDLPDANLSDMALQPDGKILITGTGGSTDVKMAIARFNSNGSIDSAFGDKTGYSVLTLENGISTGAKNVIVEADKKIILTGYYLKSEKGAFSAAKYNVDGSLDSSFGENGLVVQDFDEFTNILDAGPGALQKDGKIIVGGYGYLPDDNNFTRIALVRFNNTIIPTPPEFAKIQKWKGHYGFSWDDWSGNKTTYYSVGRSTNASTFTEIAQVQDVKGIKSYKYEDPAPPTGIVYYQLTAYRTDDKVVSSNVVTCGNDVPNNFIKLYPNPAKNSLRIEGLSATDKTKLTVIDLSGNIKVAATATAGSHTLNIAALKPGNYMLRIETNGNMVTRMFVKE